jgi:hypothetical protein
MLALVPKTNPHIPENDVSETNQKMTTTTKLVLEGLTAMILWKSMTLNPRKVILRSLRQINDYD